MLLQTFAYENANTDCQNALHPIRAVGGSLNDYIKTCADIGSKTYEVNLFAAALTSGMKQKCLKQWKIWTYVP